jgi:hypothetical protein
MARSPVDAGGALGRQQQLESTLRRLASSRFRARFALTPADRHYLRARGPVVIEEHIHRFLSERIAPAEPKNDGKQTPWRGHPVFVAQHATATCCRGCIQKWHGIAKGRELTDDELGRLEELVFAWLTKQLAA